MRLVTMYRLIRSIISTSLGLFIGFPVAFVLTPDPVGIVPILTGVILTVVLAVGFYLGMGKITATEPE